MVWKGSVPGRIDEKQQSIGAVLVRNNRRVEAACQRSKIDMPAITLFCKSIEISLETGPDIRDITPSFEQLIHESQVENGSLNATMVGSTGSLTTIEYESGVVSDLMAAVDRMAPVELEYEHEKAWHDGNGHSHVQAALLGPSIALPIRNGRLKLGTWQQAVAINHDNRARQRTIEVTIIGTVSEQ